MMKMRIGIAFFVVIGSFWSNINADECDISKREATTRTFPNISSYTVLSYELSVEYSMPKEAQYDYAKEYYDMSEAIGRVEFYSNGTKSIHFYSEDTDEGFNIADGKCETMDARGIAKYENELMTEWMYQQKPLVFGPSAMLFNAQDAFKNDEKHTKTGYMGKITEKVRGFEAQYWRRCSGDLQFDYYFSTENNWNAYNFDILKIMPLRVDVTHKDKSNEKYPQIYDIITFQPYISDRTKLEVPAGVGCKRGEEVDPPVMPDFLDKNFLIFGEAVYKDVTDEIPYDYLSAFTLAQTVNTNYMAYFFTPWAKAIKSKKTDPNGLKHVIFDMKHKYLYTNDLYNDNCEMTRASSFSPNYVFPDGNGYISLTDPAVLFSNSEFSYISDNIDRNMEVRTYEATFGNLPLRNRTVAKAVVTKNFLKDGIEEQNTVGIKNALTSINMNFYDKDDNKEQELTFNFFGFTTSIPYEEQLFDLTSCFKRKDQSIWIRLGFAADADIISKLDDVLPSIELEFRKQIETISEVNAVRMPTVVVDFSDMIYIAFLLLDRPPAILDYLERQVDTTIVSDETEGIQDPNGCAFDCLESVNDCWGFSICGSSCYFGTGKKTTESKKGCSLYRRSDNTTSVPTKETIKNNIKNRVDNHQFFLSVRTEDVGPPINLEATYFESTTAEESDELHNIVGETNPRLRVVKVGSKLDASAGEEMKNLGNLPYDKCQSLCLDYQGCETVSYCLQGSCILSTIYGEEIPNSQIKSDNLCNLLTRTYTDQFEKSPGLILSQSAIKTVPVNSAEECAKACAKETSFQCQSFDNCPASTSNTCRLHAVHYLDLVKEETAVSQETTCGHYSRKFNYGFRKESHMRVTNPVSVAAKNITLEQCAKLCFEFGNGICYGYDYCTDKLFTSSLCTLLNMAPSEMKTVYNPMCNHYLQIKMSAPESFTQSTAAWVGIVCFVIAAVVGVAATFGIGYWRANRPR